MRRALCVVAVILATAGCARGAARERLVVTRPTVIAYLVVPPGAVDTSEVLAVTADDWNYAMATLGDSVEARGFAFTMATGDRLLVESRGARPVVLSLAEATRAGYVFARPGAPPCLRRGPADLEAVLAAADTILGRTSLGSGARIACDPAR